MAEIGDLIGTLRRGGYSIRVIDRAEMQVVEVARRQDATLARPIGDRMVLDLLRRQDEAIAYLVGTGRERERLREEILSGRHDENPALLAAQICEYNILLGFERASTGERWADVRDEYLREAGSGAL